jgi:outer membrane biogenesis lipoprotein LolB
LAGLILLSACAARTPPRPSGAATPDPTAVVNFATATSACQGFRSFEGELALSGRAGDERIRGRVIAGLEAGGALRLEAPAPFGAPFFILAARSETATLLLPRERRVLRDTPVTTVLERLTGLALGAEDLRLIVSGCLSAAAAADEGRQWPGGWQAVTIGRDRVAYLRRAQGRPVVSAADYGPWQIAYADHAGGFPRRVRVRNRDGTVDVTARVDQLSVNTAISPRAWTVEVPSTADPMTLDELRSIAPLAEKPRP